MRHACLLWCALVACSSSPGSAGPQGAPGSKGDPGPKGDPGTFAGTFGQGATFAGPTALDGTTTFNGDDLFNAAWRGTYPAVLSTRFGAPLHQVCGPAPATFEVGTADGSVAFGQIVFTDKGHFIAVYGAPFDLKATCSGVVCAGPLTYILKNPGSPKTINVVVNLDNGPSYVYVDGNRGPAITSVGGVDVSIPSGSFALSLVACSGDGASIGLIVENQFITANNLQVDYDRTFHRNGQ